jgi:hypothetical protein
MPSIIPNQPETWQDLRRENGDLLCPIAGKMLPAFTGGHVANAGGDDLRLALGFALAQIVVLEVALEHERLAKGLAAEYATLNHVIGTASAYVERSAQHGIDRNQWKAERASQTRQRVMESFNALTKESEVTGSRVTGKTVTMHMVRQGYGTNRKDKSGFSPTLTPMSQATVNRILRDLERDGLIKR